MMDASGVTIGPASAAHANSGEIMGEMAEYYLEMEEQEYALDPFGYIFDYEPQYERASWKPPKKVVISQQAREIDHLWRTSPNPLLRPKS